MLGSLYRGFLLEKVGEVKAVCELPGTEGVYPSQVHVCVCCFFKTPVGGATPLSPADCLLESSLEKRAEIPAPLGTSWFVLCIFISAATRPSPLYLRGSVGCISSPGF